MRTENEQVLKIKGFDDEEIVIDYSFSGPSTLLIGTSGQIPHVDQTEEEYINVEFEEHIPESHKLDYLVAATSGFLCSMLDIFWVGQFSLEKAQDIGNQKAEDFVMNVAKKQGYKGKTLEGAIKHLEKKFPMPGDLAKDPFGGGLHHHFRDFTHHPTILGLLFSLFAQFTGLICGTDEKGYFKTVPVPCKEDYIGKDFPQKILFGTVHWVYHIVSDMAGSHQYAGEGTGLPGPLLSFLKELSSIPFIRDFEEKYKEKADIRFYQWLAKLFNGTFFWNKETNQTIRFDLRTEMGITNQLLKQALPVVINECTVRGFYFASRLAYEIKDKEIKTVKDISEIDAQKILPVNNKVLTRMLTISTGVFTAIDAGQAAWKARKGSLKEFAVDFITRVNIPGLCRFVISVAADGKYIYQDIKDKYEQYQQKAYVIHKELYKIPEWNTLSVTKEQAVLLYSLEYQMLLDDLNKTKGSKTWEKKHRWISVWKKSIDDVVSAEQFNLIEGDQEFYVAIKGEVARSNNISWLYTILLEALQFKAYTKLSEDKDNPYKGLKLNNDYLHDHFVTEQSIIDKKELSKLEKTYANYRNILLNNGVKVAAGVAATIVATAATGGAALVFAPEIATALVGGSFAGIYGVALTNASLAAIGGGALAAGGLGVAGGTAIIAGGGAAIGLIGGGAITASSALLGSSKDATLDMLTKMLTVTKISVIDRYNRKDILKLITLNMSIMTGKMEHDIEVMKDSLNNLEVAQAKELKKRINTSKECLTYMNRAYKELQKLSQIKSREEKK